MPKKFTSDEFFRALPAELRPHLPGSLSKFKYRVRPWMLQVYYHDYAVHYEASSFKRQNVFEIGLHFERNGRDQNDALLHHFSRHAFEIRAELGSRIEFEPWDKGWSKVYETVPLASYDEAYLSQIAARMARMIAALQPLFDEP